ncbi:MAG: hypothetical protein HY707_00635 [Ignavibacteriae bacterium]|nr:hypothetical protein [Ignavibacteriota bacterium]
MNIQTKLLLLLLSLSIAILITAAVFSVITLDNYFLSRVIEELKTQANQAEFVVRTFSEHNSTRYSHLQQYAQSANTRLTLIDRTGNVLFESELPEEKLITTGKWWQR